MKLRSYHLAAALFLFAGIAFAVALEPADEDSRRETIYTFHSPIATESRKTFERLFYDTARKEDLTIKLLQYSSIAETESVWGSYSTEDHNGGGNTGSAAAPDSDGRVAGEDGFHVYDLAAPFGDRITEDIGFTGRRGGEYELNFGEAETREPEQYQLPENGASGILVFDKSFFLANENKAQILFGDPYAGDFNDNDVVALPLALPIALLFLAIGAGIVLIIFTTIDDKK